MTGRPEPRRTGLATAWIAERVSGRQWWLRAPLLAVLAWIFLGYLGDPLHGSIFDGLTLGFHEMGHVVFSWLGNRILTAAGGTIFQLAIPLGAGTYLLLRQRDPFGASVCLFWLGTALFSAGIYAGDARAQALPLVSPFGPIDVDSHDWTVVLLKFGKLSRDHAIGSALRGAGLTTMAGALLTGSWILTVMRRARHPGPERSGARSGDA